MLKYRPEIDGLRAISVVPVILFHAGFELFSGGFVGVDVFFVISGYLITSILVENIKNDKFNIFDFYENRARRILPALYFLILCITMVAIILMHPEQLRDYGQSLFATVTFSSNIYFLIKADYWAQSSEFLPLLHTWSLSIEEQFYLIFPVFLFMVMRLGHTKVMGIFVVLATISFLFSEWGWRNNANSNFYLAPARGWEILSGSVAALIVLKHGVKKSNMLSLLGIGAILFSIFTYDYNTPGPSVYTMLPVGGAVLIILFADRQTVTTRLLSTKFLVWIGLISYSSYLWHQPLLALTRVYYADIDLTLPRSLTIVVSTFIMAFISYRYVERPFRSKHIFKRKFVLTVIIIPFILFSLCGFLLHKSYGLKEYKLSLLSPPVIEMVKNIEKAKVNRNALWKALLSDSESPYQNSDRINLLFLGDSLSEDLYVASKLSKPISSLFDVRRLIFDDECVKYIVTKGNELNSNGLSCAETIQRFMHSDLLRNSDVILFATAGLSNVKYISGLIEHSLLESKKVLVYQPFGFRDITSLIVSLDSRRHSLNSAEFSKFYYNNKHNRTVSSNLLLDRILHEYNIPTINGFEAFCDERKRECVLNDYIGNSYIIDQSHLSVKGMNIIGNWLFDKLVSNFTNFQYGSEVLRKN